MFVFFTSILSFCLSSPLCSSLASCYLVAHIVGGGGRSTWKPTRQHALALITSCFMWQPISSQISFLHVGTEAFQHM